jgi:hypothetical protein
MRVDSLYKTGGITLGTTCRSLLYAPRLDPDAPLQDSALRMAVAPTVMV